MRMQVCSTDIRSWGQTEAMLSFRKMIASKGQPKSIQKNGNHGENLKQRELNSGNWFFSRRCKRLNKQLRNSCQLRVLSKAEKQGKRSPERKEKRRNTFSLGSVSHWLNPYRNQQTWDPGKQSRVGLGRAGSQSKTNRPQRARYTWGTCAVGDSKDPLLLYLENLCCLYACHLLGLAVPLEIY